MESQGSLHFVSEPDPGEEDQEKTEPGRAQEDENQLPQVLFSILSVASAYRALTRLYCLGSLGIYWAGGPLNS